ncbi:MAG: hypothetical protein QOC81_1000 [Thermoanaerobaculia bacterium]|nr:hypothetical protein [Thermoanaerobaculia bacterium]
MTRRQCRSEGGLYAERFSKVRPHGGSTRSVFAPRYAGRVRLRAAGGSRRLVRAGEADCRQDPLGNRYTQRLGTIRIPLEAGGICATPPARLRNEGGTLPGPRHSLMRRGVAWRNDTDRMLAATSAAGCGSPLQGSESQVHVTPTGGVSSERRNCTFMPATARRRQRGPMSLQPISA